MTNNTADRINIHLDQETEIERWWDKHKEALRQILEQYKAEVMTSLRKAHVQNIRLTEENDALIKEVLKLKNAIARAREALGNQEKK
jgi:hypothetical protein